MGLVLQVILFTRGISCGQEGWRGGFDRYPCQHARYFRTETGWVNNITCSTKPEYTLDTEIIATYTLASLPKPGIIQLDYTNDVPLLPQAENWKIVSFPSNDYMTCSGAGPTPLWTTMADSLSLGLEPRRVCLLRWRLNLGEWQHLSESTTMPCAILIILLYRIIR